MDLRRRLRQDLEVTGNAFWELLRDGRGEIARLVYVPSYSVRLMPLDTEPVEVEDRVRVSPVAFDTVSARRRLRRYVQIQGTERGGQENRTRFGSRAIVGGRCQAELRHTEDGIRTDGICEDGRKAHSCAAAATRSRKPGAVPWAAFS